MNYKKLALFYISLISLQMAHVTFAQSAAAKANEEPGTNGAGGHLDEQQDRDNNPNHYTDSKFIYRCAYASTMTGVLPSFPKGGSTDDAMDLLLTHVRCSKVNQNVSNIPVQCDWYPSICPDNTVYIRGIRKVVNASTPHFEWACCVNQLACNTQCQQQTAPPQTGQDVYSSPQHQTDSNELAPAITSVFIHDTAGQATMDWKFCAATSICYTPPPTSGTASPGSLLGLLGLLGLIALVAIGSPSSSPSPASSGAPGAASTASG